MGIRVVCAVFLCALLDFAGLAALLPVLFFLLDDGRDKDAALLFCLVAIVFILVKNALAAGLSRFQNHFLMSLYRRLSFSLFTSYYQRGLLFIRSRGSIRLGYEVNYICYAFSLNLLSPLLRMTGELLLVFWVTAALLVYAPLTVLMLYIAFLPFMLIYGWGIRKPMRRYGEQEQQARREQSRLVTETMKGYAELELNAAFPFLQQAFAQRVRKISESRLKLETASSSLPFRNGGHIGADLAHRFRNRGYQSAGRCLCCGGFPAVTRFARHLRWLDTSTECGLFSADYRGRIGG